jgi:hypothetical protein
MPSSAVRPLRTFQTFAEPRYKQLIKKALSGVLRWEWSFGDVHEPVPYHFARNPYAFDVQPKDAKLLGVLPDDRLLKRRGGLVGCRQYGLDASGRILIVRHFTRRDRKHGWLARERLIVPRRDGLYSALFNDHPFKNVLTVQREVYKKGKIVGFDRLGEALERETYLYRSGRLREIRRKLYSRGGGRLFKSDIWMIPITTQPADDA